MDYTGGVTPYGASAQSRWFCGDCVSVRWRLSVILFQVGERAAQAALGCAKMPAAWIKRTAASAAVRGAERGIRNLATGTGTGRSGPRAVTHEPDRSFIGDRCCQ